MVASVDETARADISQLRDTGAAQVVDLHEPDTGRGAAPFDNGGVGARRKRRQDRRFMIVGRREASRDDLRLLGKSPIIVESDAGAIRGPKVQDRIRERIVNADSFQRRTQSSE